MARQDDWVRTQVRMPPELHVELSRAAGAKSLNAEIVERLAASVGLGEPRGPVSEHSVTIALETNGMPISWGEVQEHLAAISRKIKGGIVNIRMEVHTPQMVSSAEREDQADALRRSYRRAEKAERRDQPTPRNPRLDEMDRLVREKAPENMSLNRLLDRIDAGEDPVDAFEDELRKFHAGEGEAVRFVDEAPSQSKQKTSASELARSLKRYI